MTDIVALLLCLLFTSDATSGVDYYLETLLRDFFAAPLAKAVRACIKPIKSCHDRIEHLLLILQKTQSDLLLEIVGSQVGQVKRRVGDAPAGLPAAAAQGRVPQSGHVPFEPIC